jgi:hypothetical protein
LSLEEIYMVGRWILEQDQAHRIVFGVSIIGFIQETFEKTLSKKTVSKYMTKIGFSSHSAKV